MAAVCCSAFGGLRENRRVTGRRSPVLFRLWRGKGRVWWRCGLWRVALVRWGVWRCSGGWCAGAGGVAGSWGWRMWFLGWVDVFFFLPVWVGSVLVMDRVRGVVLMVANRW